MSVKRHFLSKRDVKKLRELLLKEYPREFVDNMFKLGPVEVGKSDLGTVYFFGGIPGIIVVTQDRHIPTLHLLIKTSPYTLKVLPRVIVDMGAVKRIINGADIMAPGIKGFEGEFEVGDVVVVVDEEKYRPIAVGEALVSRFEAENMERGKAIKNLHYIGDKYWKKLMKK